MVLTNREITALGRKLAEKWNKLMNARESYGITAAEERVRKQIDFLLAELTSLRAGQEIQAKIKSGEWD